MRKYKILVKPNKKENKVYWQNSSDKSEILIVETKEPPIEGRANDSVIELLAEFFGISKTNISIKSGKKARVKTIIIDK